MMRGLLIVLATVLSSGICNAQQLASTTSHADFESAIEKIATSQDAAEVRQADALLRSGGVRSIKVLALHLEDQRQSRTNFLARAVTGKVTMGDHCFWVIQDQLERHTSKMDASFSALNRENIADWLDARSGMSLPQLRKEACIGSFRMILGFEKQYPDYDIAPTLRAYAKKLVALDAAATKDSGSKTADAAPSESPADREALATWQNVMMPGHELHATLRTRPLNEPALHLSADIVLPKNPFASSDPEFMESVARSSSMGKISREGIRSVLYASYADGEKLVVLRGLQAASGLDVIWREAALRAIWADNMRLDRVRIHRKGMLLVVVWHRGLSDQSWQAVNAGVAKRL